MIYPETWIRYDDDTFVINKNNLLRSTDNLLNGVFDNIKYTLQAESDNRFPFLYILITRSNSEKFETPSDRKPNHIDQILSYSSNNTATWRISCTKTRFENSKDTFHHHRYTEE